MRRRHLLARANGKTYTSIDLRESYRKGFRIRKREITNLYASLGWLSAQQPAIEGRLFAARHGA